MTQSFDVWSEFFDHLRAPSRYAPGRMSVMRAAVAEYSDRAQRRLLAGLVLMTSCKIFDIWSLSNDEKQQLCGMDDVSL